MAQLTADVSRKFDVTNQESRNQLPVKAATTIWQGSAVGSSAGYMRQLVAADSFRGFARAKADNSAGADGDVEVDLIEEGVVEALVTGVTALTDVGATVYMSDGNTFTLTSAGNSKVGTIKRVVSAGSTLCKIYFRAPTADVA